MAETIGCCGYYQECATKGACVREERLKKEDMFCLYRENLDRGFNFYNSQFKAGPYLEQSGRQYQLNILSEDGLRRLTENEQQILKDAGLSLSPFVMAKARIDHSERKEQIGWVVRTVVDGLVIDLMKVNGCPMMEFAAERLKTDLDAVGFQSEVRRHDSARPSLSEPVHQTPSPAPIKPVKEGQVNLFDLF